jgi:hypothetical protein
LYSQEINFGKVSIARSAVALIFLLASFVRFCPLHTLVRLTTCHAKNSVKQF